VRNGDDRLLRGQPFVVRRLERASWNELCAWILGETLRPVQAALVMVFLDDLAGDFDRFQGA